LSTKAKRGLPLIAGQGPLGGAFCDR